MRKSGRNKVRAKIANTRGRKEAKGWEREKGRKRGWEECVYSVSFHTYIYLITITGKYMTICTASYKL